TCTYLSNENVNILDISQTIVSGYFNMMMIVDISGMKDSFETLVSGLDDLGKQIGVSIKCQKEEIFDMMHRI
ncbi:MAG: ACT domain-containing protein, partial [Lachnospiraceae bacterium]|nr:ACT domain-containing protein [Lachnospiraceae bacterium]